MSLLEVNGLNSYYGDSHILFDVSLHVDKNEVVALLGRNGAGKSTTFKSLMGVVTPRQGSVKLDGQELAGKKAHEIARVGMQLVHEERRIFGSLNVEENIRAILELLDLPKSEVDDRLENLLAELHIDHVRHINAAALSGGERRRCEIARALATNPRFILLDEPFAGVDPIAVLEIQKIIRFLKERGIGVLITDHNVRETLGICDHAYIINAGRVLAAGRPAEIVDNESVRKVYLGEHFKL